MSEPNETCDVCRQRTRVRPFDLPILLDSGTATLRMPVPMSESDYALLTNALATFLELYRTQLIASPSTAEDPAS